MHRTRALISAALAVLLLATAVSPALAATQAELRKHEEAADRARAQARKAEATAKKLASEVAELDGEIERYEEQAASLSPKIEQATSRTRRLQREVENLSSEVAETKQQIAETQDEYERQQKLLQDRVQSSYRQGDWFYLDILLGSEDIGDLIARSEFVTRVIQSNNDLARGLEVTEQKLTRSKVKLDRSLQSVKLKRREAAEVERGLRNLRAQRQAAAAAQEAVQSRKQGLVAENKRNAKRLLALAEEEEAESQRIARELAAAGSGSGQFTGEMAWPVPSSYRITSEFGWRIHPIFGSRRFHSGIDIGAPGGAEIVSAGAGQVIYVGYRGGYGNTVMVDHGDGVVTLYAHQSSVSVGTGQRVEKGQRIGAVGSTGNSTGPHLHFEVRVNGSPRNPRNYL